MGARLAVSALHAAEAVPQVPVAAEATPQDATRRTDVTVTTTAATVTVPEAATASVMVRMTVSEMTSATPRTTVTATRNARNRQRQHTTTSTPPNRWVQSMRSKGGNAVGFVFAVRCLKLLSFLMY